MDNSQITISRQLLLENGYKLWSERPATEPHIVAKYQKCVYDSNGRKKYFINIDETFGWNPETRSVEQKHNFWPSIQFNIAVGDSYNSLNIQLVQWFNESGVYSGISIQQMEEKIEEIFVSLNGQFYE